jgi:hypothetical protein
MNSNATVESESCTVASSIADSRSNSMSSVSSTESIHKKMNNDKQGHFVDDSIEAEMIYRKAMQQLSWRKTRTISVDSQEATPRYTIPVNNIPIRKRDIYEPIIRRDTPTVSHIQKIIDKKIIDKT